MAADLETVLTRIVEGQIRSYMNDHPEVFTGVHSADAVRNGIRKRIVGDLIANTSRIETLLVRPHKCQ